MIKGITVKLIRHEQTGTDSFGAKTTKEVSETVDNVLVSPVSSEDNVNNMQLYGRMASYSLAIPKGDNHKWENAEVEFFGRRWRTIGIPVKGIESNIPLAWNAKVQVERYE